MKNLVLASIIFALGVYVGRPPQVVVQAPPILKDCTVVQKTIEAPSTKRPEVDDPFAHAVHVEGHLIRGDAAIPEPTPSPTPSETPVAESTKNEDVAPRDQEPTTWTDAEAAEWIKDMVAQLAKYVGAYEVEEHRVSIDAKRYAHLNQLREALDKAGLRISEEGAMAIGDYVYYIKVMAK